MWEGCDVHDIHDSIASASGAIYTHYILMVHFEYTIVWHLETRVPKSLYPQREREAKRFAIKIIWTKYLISAVVCSMPLKSYDTDREITPKFLMTRFGIIFYGKTIPRFKYIRNSKVRWPQFVTPHIGMQQKPLQGPCILTLIGCGTTLKWRVVKHEHETETSWKFLVMWCGCQMAFGQTPEKCSPSNDLNCHW